MKPSTVTAGILFAALLLAVIALYGWIGVIAYQCMTSDDLAVRALGAITALLIILTLDGANKIKAHDTADRNRTK